MVLFMYIRQVHHSYPLFPYTTLFRSKKLEKLARESIATHVQAMLDMQQKGAITFDYGNNIRQVAKQEGVDRKSTRLNSSHVAITYAVFCLKKKKKKTRKNRKTDKNCK